MADQYGSDHVERALKMQKGTVLANEVLRLRTQARVDLEVIRLQHAQLEELRARVTTGGPAPRFTDQWENGASSRPSTAPPEDEVVQLPHLGEVGYAVDHIDEPPPR